MEKDLQKMVNEDIIYCREYWSLYSHDKEKMEKIFNKILFRYMGVIQNFSQDMKVISNSENSAKIAESYRTNMELLIKRLEVFKENGYSNEGLKDYYINKDVKQSEKKEFLDFSETRIAIGMQENLTSREKEEIISKIDEMEEICAMVETKKRRWDLLRPYVIWVSGKDVKTAMKLLPLFLRID